MSLTSLSQRLQHTYVFAMALGGKEKCSSRPLQNPYSQQSFLVIRGIARLGGVIFGSFAGLPSLAWARLEPRGRGSVLMRRHSDGPDAHSCSPLRPSGTAGESSIVPPALPAPSPRWS